MKSSTILSIISLLLAVAVHVSGGEPKDELSAITVFYANARKLIRTQNNEAADKLKKYFVEHVEPGYGLKEVVTYALMLEEDSKTDCVAFASNMKDLQYWKTSVTIDYVEGYKLCDIIKSIMANVGGTEIANEVFADQC